MSFRTAQLRYFVTVAQEGQVTRAAAKLHIAQPALSQAISQMEVELGIKLFERHARGVTLTPAGERLLPKARLAVEREHDAELQALSLTRDARQAIEFGFVGPPPTSTIAALLDAFALHHPDADVSLRDLPFPIPTWSHGSNRSTSHSVTARRSSMRFEPSRCA